MLTTLVMGGVLVGTGVAGYVNAEDAADSVVLARAGDAMRLAQRVAHRQRDPKQVVVDIQEALVDQGVSYVAILVDGQIVAHHGTADVGEAVAVAAPRRHIQLYRIGAKIGIEGPLMFRRHRGRQGPPGKLGRRVRIEVIPQLSERLTDGARIQLMASLTAAVLLFGAALLFWRSARRADAMAADLHETRRLAALGEMSAVLGHELRNPLASLKGNAQLVCERLEPGHRAERPAERVVREALRLEELTGHILDFAREQQVSIAPQAPAEVLQTALDAVSAEEHGVAGLTEHAPSRWLMDGPRVGQVLTNLLKNALEASPEPGSVTASCAQAGDDLVFAISDRGPGIPEAALVSIFEPFQTSRVKGTGLGLAIARRIIDAHGGELSAMNRDDGPGARFVVRLRPAAAAAAQRER